MRSMISQESDEQLRNILYQELEQIKVEDDLSEKYKIWEDEAWQTIDAEISDPLIKNTIKSHHGRTISYSNENVPPKDLSEEAISDSTSARNKALFKIVLFTLTEVLAALLGIFLG